MKKKLALLCCAIIAALSAGNANVEKYASPAAKANAAKCVDYLWFTDIDLTNLVGSTGDVTTECDRLRRLFSGYTFSPVPSTGLYAFEFGYFPLFNIAIIYSNMQYV